MKKSLILFFIFIISFLVRIYRIDQLPTTLNRDEAALAYNASLLEETGRDEWGKSWPLSLESFGDYKLPGYVYSLVGLFKVFPQEDWVVRLPSALAGSILVLLAFFFAKTVKFREPWAWLFTVLIAATPVFFFYSRIAFEANLALVLFISALTLLLSKVDGKKRFILDLLAIILILFSVFTYNTPLLLLPFILPIFIWLRGLKYWRKWIIPAISLSLIIGIAGYQLLSLSSQKSEITVFQDETTWSNSIIYRQQFSGVWQTALGNKYAYYFYLISQNYVKSFSSAFLVSGQSGHPWHTLPEHGHLLSVVYFFGLIGILATIYELLLAIKNNKFPKIIRTHASLLYLLLVSLLPAVVTVDAPHATRSLLFFFIFNLFTLLGLKTSYHFIRDHTQIKKYALFTTFSILLIGLSLRYSKNYFTNYPSQQQSLKPGFEQVIQQVDQQYPDQEIAVIDQEGYQYILLAWYLKISPEEFSKSVVRQLPDKIGFRYGEQVGNYHFIADLDDRSEEEKIIVNWNEVKEHWEILEF
jgi:4-amino-4-deoxy-L-arabinose transferase-like glycosyltransferase